MAILLVTLAGAVLGGKLGDRYHRRVDRAGFDALIHADHGPARHSPPGPCLVGPDS